MSSTKKGGENMWVFTMIGIVVSVFVVTGIATSILRKFFRKILDTKKALAAATDNA